MASSDSTAESLAETRARAQQHLHEIEVERASEEAQLRKAEAEIQRYAKTSAADRKKSMRRARETSVDHAEGERQLDAADGPETNATRFRPFDEVLYRLRWDDKFAIEEYVVGYLERFDGIKEMPASKWIRDFSEEDWMPMHRARYVKRSQNMRRGEADQGPDLGIVWDRDARIDRLSG